MCVWRILCPLPGDRGLGVLSHRGAAGERPCEEAQRGEAAVLSQSPVLHDRYEIVYCCVFMFLNLVTETAETH